MRPFLLAAAAALLLSACGYVSDVQPPLANVPAAVQNLAAVQRGANLIVQFPVPRRTTEDKPIKGDLTLDLRIGTAEEPFDPAQWAARARRVEGAHINNGIARYEIPSKEFTGKEEIIGARVIGANGKESRWSNYEIVEVVPPPEQPHSLAATPSPEGVRLTWTAKGDLFRTFRRVGDQGPFTAMATVDKPEWTDAATDFGKRYVYRVQTIVKLPREKEAESELSEEAGITPQDVFPPAPPQRVRAAAAPNSIELVWDANTEPFLAGYRVYRAAPGGDYAKVADVGLVPSYSDRAVERGKTYRYRVTAVSNSGKESPPSQTVEASSL